jgi:2-polyprenyl-6-methoxyphenol hydroxylase-like FAD-dependent oxidoreductase
VENLVVDRREGPHRAPQAHVVNPRTLEIFRQVGLDTDALRARATRREDGSWVRWMTRLDGEELGALPYERQGDENLAFTPTPLLNLSQHVLGPILLDHAQAARPATVAIAINGNRQSRTSAGLRRASAIYRAERATVRSRYVLAADGASSRVRRSLGVEMLGPDRLQAS